MKSTIKIALIFTFLCIFTSSLTSCQKDKDAATPAKTTKDILVGTWEFNDGKVIYEGGDPVMLTKNDLTGTLVFNTNGNFISTTSVVGFNQMEPYEEKGTWQLKNNNKTIEVTIDGEPSDIEILTIDPTKLTIEIKTIDEDDKSTEIFNFIKK